MPLHVLGLITLIILPALAALWILVKILTEFYNRIVFLKNQVDRAWSNIEVILGQRSAEIPPLLGLLQDLLQHEQEIIQSILDSMNRENASTLHSDQIRSYYRIRKTLLPVDRLSEAYPDLRASEGFMNLQSRLSALEAILAERREVYNLLVTNWNTLISTFPGVILKEILGLSPMPLFIDEEKENNETF